MISNGKLFISGGGKAKDSFLLDKAFVASLSKGKILYIPVGLKRDIVGYEECYDWIKNTLSIYTKKDLEITMWIDIKGKTERDFKEFDAIYIGGAKDTDELMQKLRKNNFINNLVNFLKKGGMLYGGSAGAVIIGKYIISMNKDAKQIAKLGLGLLKKYSIYCHYNKNQDIIINNFIKTYKTPVVALPENSGLIIEGDNVLVEGYSNIVVFYSNFKKNIIKPKKFFNL